MRGRTGAGVAAILLLSACGSEAEAPTGGAEPATPQSFAAIIADHLGEPDSASEPSEVDDFGRRAVGAEVRYHSDGEYDGDLVAVLAATDVDPALTDCDAAANDYLEGCETTDEGLLFWEGETPEEDPGVVYVAVQKGATTVLAFHTGPVVDADPRELEAEVSVADLFDLVNDPRLDVTTSTSAVEAGAELDYWTKG